MMSRKATPAKAGKKTKGRPQSGSTQEDAREALLKAAVPLFAAKGFSGTSVKDIADKAGVNVSLVSYHFDGKEGLYRTCIEDFGKHRLANVERMLQPASTREEFRVRLEMFIDDLMVWFDEEPDLCALVQREAEMGFKLTRDVFEQTFLKIYTSFFGFVKAAQAKSFLRADADVDMCSRFFFTGFMHVTKQDDRAKKWFGVDFNDPAYRKRLKTQLSRVFFEGMQAPTGSKEKVSK